MRWIAHILAIISIASPGALGCSNRPSEKDLELSSRSKAVPLESASLDALGPNTTTSAKHVGDPCVVTDGWYPPQYGAPVTPGSPPSVTSMHGVDVVRRDQLPPRVGFCLEARTAYPTGYFTMNCEVDADCPDGAQCDNVNLCRKACSADTECRSPTTCAFAPGPQQTLRYCWLQRPNRAHRTGPVAGSPVGHGEGFTSP
jgi:hypothetical protein